MKNIFKFSLVLFFVSSQSWAGDAGQAALSAAPSAIGGTALISSGLGAGAGAATAAGSLGALGSTASVASGVAIPGLQAATTAAITPTFGSSAMSGIAGQGAQITAVGGGADAVSGGFFESIGTSLKNNPWTVAAGVAMLGMAAMQFASMGGNDDASSQADSSKQELTSLTPPAPTNTLKLTGGTDGTTQTVVDTTNTTNQKDPNNSLTTTLGGSNLSGANASGTGSNGNGDKSKAATIDSKSVQEHLADIQKNLAESGVVFDPKTMDITLPNGDKFNTRDLRPENSANLPASMQEGYKQALGIANEVGQQIASGSGLSNSSGGGLSSSLASTLSRMNDSKGGGLGGLGGINGDGSGSSAYGGYGSGGGDENGGGANGVGKGKGGVDPRKLVNGRFPASEKVAGLSKNYNGEPIGVAEDSIFSMVTRRYELKSKENTFINDLINNSVNPVMNSVEAKKQ